MTNYTYWNVRNRALQLAILVSAFIVLIPVSANAETAPACPLLPQPGRTIIMLGAGQEKSAVFIRSDLTAAEATFGPVPAPIPSGTYDVTLMSWDSHFAQGLSVIQPYESFFLRLYDAGSSLVASTNAISDLPADEETRIELVQTGLIISSPIASLDAIHSEFGGPGASFANSIVPICAAFDLVPPPPPPPACVPVSSGGITINICNSGSITNSTSAKSSTGGNTAGGSVGGTGGAGGGVAASGGNFNNGGASAGGGGDGGSGGPGGLVQTGNASAQALTMNDANDSDVDLEVPEEMNSSSIAVNVFNLTLDCDCPNRIGNSTRARASTGENSADGSTGGDGGSASDITAGSGDNNNGGASSSGGGRGGTSGVGGTILTGDASSNTSTANYLNRTRVRVR